MCAGAIYFAGIREVVFGCSASALHRITKEGIQVSASLILGSGLAHGVNVIGPILEDECVLQHKAYWKGKHGNGTKAK